MIKRYTPEEIGSEFTDQQKFQSWLDVELVVIKVRCKKGEYPAEVYNRIKAQAKFDVKEIIELDKKIEHDMIAFIENVRSYLDPDLRKHFHDGLTSYDIEIPAQALQILRAGAVILKHLRDLITVVHKQSSVHMWTYRMGMTHGKDAKPSTFGWLLCTYLDALKQRKIDLSAALDQIKGAKCSGAVGNYMTLSPELEEAVLEELNLKPRPATQIVMRDSLANLLSQIATAGGVLEKIAIDFRLMATSRFGEVEEPRRQNQKGSSAMPHKKNPILLERMSGMPSVLRGYSSVMQENIKTWLERDIAHSSVERIIVPDSMCLFDYMLLKMTWIIDNLVVNREKMKQNIDAEHGVWASEEVKQLLCAEGYDTEAVYIFVQKCSFEALNNGWSFKTRLLESKFLDTTGMLMDHLDSEKLDACFDLISKLKNLEIVYQRCGLDSTLALKPN